MKRLVTEGATSSNVANPADVSARDRVRKKRVARKRHRTLRIVLVTCAICTTLVLAYGIGLTYFSSHYYPGTVVAGIDAAGLTEAELAHALMEHVESYEAKVDNGSFELVVPGSAIDLSCDANKVATKLMVGQDATSWPLGLMGASMGNRVDAGVTYGVDKLVTLVTKAVAAYNKSATQPVSASLALDEGGTEFVVTPEKGGTALNTDAVYAATADAVEHGRAEVTLSEDDLIQPAYRENDEATRAALARANQILAQDINLARGEDVLTTLEPATFASWLVVNDDLTLGADAEKAGRYLDEWLWQWTDYVDDANIYSVTPAGFAKGLSAFLQAGAKGVFEVPYTTTPRYVPGQGKLSSSAWKSDVGRYIDVNIKDQVACMYDEKGRVMWETPVTTGNVSAECGTPVGKFAIYDKKTDFKLLGEDKDDDGKPDYEVHVDFWLPFNQGIGLHDAKWRKKYGGDEYLLNGSGGCINTPREAIEKLYTIAHVGDVVIVHE